MASNKSSSGSKRIMVPEARAAMDQFKMEAANEVGVNLKKGYNGSLTSREAGSIGGQMVKKMSPKRITNYERESRTAMGHCLKVRYISSFTL
ncbi:MAG: alpha/beta-type small acid-soluble spore protein [Ruminiclostridium sp.]|nr:alpha/beta-type small acid-soluble spore protein [Ruminiclostridium sp.]